MQLSVIHVKAPESDLDMKSDGVISSTKSLIQPHEPITTIVLWLTYLEDMDSAWSFTDTVSVCICGVISRSRSGVEPWNLHLKQVPQAISDGPTARFGNHF